MSGRLRPGAVAFVTGAVTLSSQILVHRMISAHLWNNYAFLVISLTMLGFAVSGVILSRYQDGLSAHLEDTIAVCAGLFALTMLGASFALYHADTAAQWIWNRPAFLKTLIRFSPLALLYAVPFGFCGLALGILLSSPRLPTRRIYCFDLVGSALGAVLVLPLLSRIGVERSVLLGCGALLVVPVLFGQPRRRSSLLILLAGACGVVVTALLPSLVFRPPKDVEFMEWDPLARIEVRNQPAPPPESNPYPSLIGRSATFRARLTKVITQNNFAFTRAPAYESPASLEGFEDTIYATAYVARATPSPRVLVIGVGGGFDVLTAMRFGAREIVGVEANAATLDILKRVYRPFFERWVEDPRVRLVHGEGRHFVATSPAPYDVIQLSGVDSYSGTPAAANVFSENYLYTAEAFDAYLSRLTENGILNMMRLEYNPEREMLKALVTAVGALRRAGIEDPSRHLVMVAQRDGAFSALLMKKTPFAEPELDRLRLWTSTNPYIALWAEPADRETRGNMYRLFLSLKTPPRERAFVETYPFSIAPATDDRPFFFRHSYWSHVLEGAPPVSKSVPAMEFSLLVLWAVIGCATLLCVYLPLRHLAREGMKAPSAGRYAVYCGGIGLGYMAVEIALLQKFGLFLGHPNYALSVVLAALLLSTGLGSLFSGTIAARLGGTRFVAYVLAFLVIGEYAFALPGLASLVGLPFPIRVAIVGGLVAPIGACLGVFFPSVLEQLKSEAPSFVPWAWGINGIFSVLGPVLSIALSMTWGISALLLGAVPVYLLAVLALPPPSPR